MKRNAAIDCLRVFAIISVIFVHVEGTGIAYGPAAKLISHFIFAVPFFMIVAGYQWGKKIQKGASIRRTCVSQSSRILKMFLFWSLVYLVVPLNVQGLLDYPRLFSHYGALALFKIPFWRFLTLVKAQGNNVPATCYVVIAGTKYHLWFLTALVWASSMTGLFLKWKREGLLTWFAACFFLFGSVFCRLLSEAFPGSSVSPLLSFGPFFGSSFFFVLGCRLSSVRRPFSLAPALALIGVGAATEAIDLFMVSPHFGVTAVHSFVEATVGIGCVLLALAKPSLGSATFLPKLGQYTLGVYVLHPLFVDFLKPFASCIPGAIRGLAFPFAAFVVCTLAAMALAKIRFLSAFVATSRPGSAWVGERGATSKGAKNASGPVLASDA